MRYLSLFSGIGSPETALRNLGIEYELVGFSEIDKYAIESYCKVHNVDKSLNLGDITKIDIEKLPKDIDIITHGSPCQDFSVAGHNRGGDIGTETRSSLMWNTVAICEQVKPKYVIWENVKNVLSVKHRHNFDKYIEEMERIGYNNFYKVLNAKNFGVPQNRERIFVISIRKDLGQGFEFPEGYDNGTRLKDILENEVDEKFYIDTEKAEKLISEYKGNLAISHSIRSREFQGQGWKENCPTLCARDYKDPKNVIMPCITPDRIEKRQNGRRVYNPDGISPTINTMQGGNTEPKIICEERYDEGLRFFKGEYCGSLRTNDGCGYKRVIEPLYKVRQATKQGYALAYEGDSINLEQPSSTTRRGRVGTQCANTLNTSAHQAVVTNYRIRKLTPLECWRLMGFNDVDFKKAATLCSNSQLYKQAGNSIVVNVMEEIFKNLIK